MKDNPYAPFAARQLSLTDLLALDRNKLANERTMLAYVRTALALFGGGLAFVRFFGQTWMEVVGWVFMPAGCVVLVVGLLHYRREHARLAVLLSGGEPSA